MRHMFNNFQTSANQANKDYVLDSSYRTAYIILKYCASIILIAAWKIASRLYEGKKKWSVSDTID